MRYELLKVVKCSWRLDVLDVFLFLQSNILLHTKCSEDLL